MGASGVDNLLCFHASLFVFFDEVEVEVSVF